MVNLDIDKNAVYVLAGNTGADSMALSHMLLEQEAKFVMCFVNYNIGPEWNDTEAALRKYCEEKGIQFEALDADQVDQTGKDANFEKWARKVRYDFFAEVYKKYDAAALFLCAKGGAHGKFLLEQTVGATADCPRRQAEYRADPAG